MVQSNSLRLMGPLSRSLTTKSPQNQTKIWTPASYRQQATNKERAMSFIAGLITGLIIADAAWAWKLGLLQEMVGNLKRSLENKPRSE